ncbi:hypothetical protein JIN85_11825 [Luteolibacter pohnpeiensis]|uniref:LamG-like jellyroll fold domain-containing protein n=1 Tax=Luteolibacter pohnpeiensis TaxID=454153 RepID=A0A934S8C7_9BACT|nr:LamG domain-containing protein [Luteolibacter pohnpeiensis]MBK1883109.1 hypothetical protein [Luteolibacter pohnpeiensis]
MNLLRLAGLFPLIVLTSQAATLFEDTFNRADNRNIDEVLTGITANTSPVLSADTVYSQPQLDPNNAAPTYGAQDADASNGGGAQIISNALQLAVGAGTSNAFINHNFVDASILSAGTFSISLEINAYAGTTTQQGGAFAIGMSLEEASATRDAWAVGSSDITQPSMTGAFNVNGTIGNPVPGPAGGVASDFWIALRGNGSVAWGGNTGNVMGKLVTAKTGTITVNFQFADVANFNAGTVVNYQVLYNLVEIGSGSFAWSGTNENYIGLDARDGTGVTMDNFKIATELVTPVGLPPSVTAFEATKLPGTLNTRFHWIVAEGTAGDPVSIEISDGTNVLHTSTDLTGFADVDASSATSFTLTASNETGDDGATTTFPVENSFSTAVRADTPAMWYRFCEATGSSLIVDSAPNAAPHEGSLVGAVVTGNASPLDKAASFPGTASILTDLIFDPAAQTQGFTIEAIVKRDLNSPADAAIISQNDGTGLGRSYLAVDSDGAIESFLAGGPGARKDADDTLDAETWVHLVMVVDTERSEMRWYLDGVEAGTTADSMNPDGSVFLTPFELEAADGNWRIGTQKSAATNFWLGSMDEVIVYQSLLDDVNGDGDTSDSHVAAHADAWLSSVSGLLGFSSSAQAITSNGQATLKVKVASDVTSVSINNGIGSLTPVNGYVTVNVSPSSTTTYTVTTTSPSGTQSQSITITFESAVVILTAVKGEYDFVITFQGQANTTYQANASIDLIDFTDDIADTTTDETGYGVMTIPSLPDTPEEFYQLQVRE